MAGATTAGTSQRHAAAAGARPAADSVGAVPDMALWSTPDGVDAALYHPQTGWQTLDRAPDTAGTQVAAAAAGRPPCRWPTMPLWTTSTSLPTAGG